VELIELPDLCRVVAKDYTFTWPQGDSEAFIHLLAEKFPSKEKSIHGFISELTNVAEEAAKPFDRSSILAKLLFPVTHRAMWGIRKLTPAQLLDKPVKDPELHALLSVFGAITACRRQLSRITGTAIIFLFLPRLSLRLHPLLKDKKLVWCPLNWSVLLGELCIIMYGVRTQ